jgi:hypothetical protein
MSVEQSIAKTLELRQEIYRQQKALELLDTMLAESEVMLISALRVCTALETIEDCVKELNHE